jgi:hypothetical protein
MAIDEVRELFNEYALWYATLARDHGSLPRSISGVSPDGKQFIALLEGMSLDHIQRHYFIKRALKLEGANVFAYASLIGTYDEQAQQVDERLQIISGNNERFLRGEWNVYRDSEGSVLSIEPLQQHEGSNPQDLPGAWFLTDALTITADETHRYDAIWYAMRSDVQFRDRRNAEAQETPLDDEKMSLRNLLKRDFSFDLKISGGFGQSRDDPIVVTAFDPAEAAATEMRVLRGIGKGRGILWRTLARTPLKHEGLSLEQVKIETKEVTDNEIITQRENYYFDVGAATLDGGTLPTAIGFRDTGTGLVLPYEIGWIHFDNVTDNEPVAPGLGQSIAYGAPGIKATVYVYDRGRGDIPTNASAAVAKDEFRAAISDLMTLNPDARLLGDVMESAVTILQKFVVDENLSVVALTVRRGKFVKLRITFVQDPLLVELVERSLAAFQDVVAGYGDQVVH